jgi:hypothetical protein
MKSLSEHTLDRAVKYHIENQIPIYENVFRVGTPMHFRLLESVKELYESGDYVPLNEDEQAILETDIGVWDIYEDGYVPLDYPMFTEEKEPELNKPKRGGNKKFYVYVRDPKTKNIKKVEFGDTSGLKIKIDDPEARKSFAARHDCANKKDRTTPGYWSCNLPRYGKQLGLSPSSTGNFFW